MAKCDLFLLGVFFCMSTGSAYKILVVFPLPDESHGILGSAMVKHLINYGHEVTYITPFIVEYPHPHLQQVDVSSNLNLMPKESTNVTSLMGQASRIHESIISDMLSVAVKTLENKNVQKLMNDPKQQFDLIIIEWMFSELLTGLSAVFEAPYILSWSNEPHWIITRLIDDTLNPSYNSDPLSENVPPFTFYQRLVELWTQIKVSFYMYMNHDIERQEYERLIAPIIKKKGREPPSFYDVKYNASLVLGNSHVSLGSATTVPQAYKSVGGYHVEEEVMGLPPNIKEIMDKAKYGVIFFNMGPLINSTDLPDDLKYNLLNMFGSLKQTVIWNFDDDIDKLPKNVHVLKQAPQQSILDHKKCALFISQGDQLSITEAIHFGVPIIGIPLFGEQFANIERAVKKGVALKVKLSSSVADGLKLAIEEIFKDKRYSETVKKISVAYHHRPIRPGAELVQWAEHVITTQGAPLLRSHGGLVPWYQKLYLDLMVILIGLFFVVKLLKRLSKLFLSKKIDGIKKKN